MNNVLPFLENLEILSLLYEVDYQDNILSKLDDDLRYAAKIWSASIMNHSSIRFIRFRNHSLNWLPVYLLRGDKKSGWIFCSNISWSPWVEDIKENSLLSEPLLIIDSFTKLDIMLTASLILANSWLSSISLKSLSLRTREAIITELDILNKKVSNISFYKWDLIALKGEGVNLNTLIERDPEGIIFIS